MTAANVSSISISIVFFALLAIVVGVFLFETILSPGPTIPAPAVGGERPRPENIPELPDQASSRFYTVFVYPKDADRLAQTIELDVSAHGGWTIRNEANRRLTLAVTEDYLARIGPLTEDSGERPRVKAYQEWAQLAAAGPDYRLIGQPADTSITLTLMPPNELSPASRATIKIAAAIAAVAFLMWACTTLCEP